VITREAAIGKVRQALQEHRLDALVASSPPTVRYATVTSFHTQVSTSERLGLGSVTAHGAPCFRPPRDRRGPRQGRVVAHGLYHAEDMIEIIETGQRVLARSADWSVPMVIG